LRSIQYKVQRRAIPFQALWERKMKIIPMDLVILVVILIIRHHHRRMLMDFLLTVLQCMDILIIHRRVTHMVRLHRLTLIMDGIKERTWKWKRSKKLKR